MKRKKTKAETRVELFGKLALALERAYRHPAMCRQDIDRILAAVVADWQSQPVRIDVGGKS